MVSIPAFQAGGTGSNPATRSKKNLKTLDKLKFMCYNAKRHSGVEQVVAHLVHIQEVAGSTPASASNGVFRIKLS